MEHLSSFASVPAIMMICYFVIESYRWLITNENGELKSKKALGFTPILCGVIGMILGILTYYQNPHVIHSDNVLTAAVNGMSSGLASVGVWNSKNNK